MVCPVISGKAASSRYAITPSACTGNEGKEGVCMFNFQCYQYNGTILGTCVERFLFGACCGGIVLPTPLAVASSHPPPSSSTTTRSDVEEDGESMQQIYLDNLQHQPIENIETHSQMPNNDHSSVDPLSLVSRIVESSSNSSTDRPLPNYFHVRPVLSPENSVVLGEFYLDKTQEEDTVEAMTTPATPSPDPESKVGQTYWYWGECR